MVQDQNEARFLSELAELFVTSKTAADYCRSLVMNPVVSLGAVGAQIMLVNQDATISHLSSFGKTVFPTGDALSMWDDNLVSQAIRENTETYGLVKDADSGKDLHVFVYPYRRPSNPVGAAVMVKADDRKIVLDTEDQRTVGLMGALWLETLGLGDNSMNGSKNSNPEELTSRQRTILQQIAAGKTNAEIARDLILSESSIRQETVKIYRALGVGTRQEASKRALHLGLIDRVAI